MYLYCFPQLGLDPSHRRDLEAAVKSAHQQLAVIFSSVKILSKLGRWNRTELKLKKMRKRELGVQKDQNLQKRLDIKRKLLMIF